MSNKDLVKEAPFHPGYEDAFDMHSDKGYEVGTHEEQQAFDKKRNIPTLTIQEQEIKAFLQMAESMKALEQQLATANDRIRQLEAQIYGGSVK
jgi:hypothetical protein